MEAGYPNQTISETPKNNKKLVFIAMFLVAIVMLLATVTYLISHISNSKQTTSGNYSPHQQISGTTLGKSGPTGTPASQQSPHVQFTGWVEPKITPAPRASAPVYGFKQNYSLNDVTNLADKLNAGSVIKNDGTNVFAYSLLANTNVNALRFDEKSGSFTYLNTAGLPLSSGASSTEAKIYDFLKSMNLYDPSLKITATYKRKDYPNVTVYEIHRDWTNAGLPILNYEGLFNIPETQTLSTLQIDIINSDLPADETVYATSDGRDGYQRPADFNTLSIFVDNTNKVVGINSNLRQLSQSPKTSNLISYQAALTKLKNNQYDAIFTSPSGSGNIAWNKIYPQNKAISDKAIIQEAVYAYLEKLPFALQPDLQPYYLFRGSSVLKSGYSVDFIAAVSATDSPTQKDVLGVSTLAQNSSVQQGVLSIDPTNPPAIDTPPVGQDVCHPSKTELTVKDHFGNVPPQITSINGQPFGFTLSYLTYRWVYKGASATHGVIGWLIAEDKNGDTSFDPRWYWVPPADISTKPTEQLGKLWQDYNYILAHRHDFDAEMLRLSGGNAGFYTYSDKSGQYEPRNFTEIERSYLLQYALTGSACPNVFTGFSPVLFVYGPAGKTVDVKTKASLTYADPKSQDNRWHVTVNSHNLTVNNTQRDYIYYEYAKQSFTRPQLGWNIAKKDIKTFSDNIGYKMQLKPEEVVRLQYELQNAAIDINDDSVFIGLIDQKEINAKLPLIFQPIPDSIQRYHFYIGKVNSESINAPQLYPIERKEFMVVEFGAIASPSF